MAQQGLETTIGDEERTFSFSNFNIKLTNGADATRFTDIKVVLQKSGTNTIVKLGGKTEGVHSRGDISATVFFINTQGGTEGKVLMPLFHAFCPIQNFSVQASDVGGSLYDETDTLSLDCEAPSGYLPC